MDYNNIPSPCYVVDERKLKENLTLLRSVQERAEVSIILALKGFAMWKFFPLVAQYLKGATASSLNEARLIYEEMGCRAHTYCVACHPDEFDDILKYSEHLVFNSLRQFYHFRPRIQAFTDHKISVGIRVNHGYSTVETDLYNPAAPGSRLGEPETAFRDGLPEGIEGLHFHSLCESSSYDLEKTLMVFEKKFGHLFPNIKWVNFGGGHLMTRKGYDIDHLVELLRNFRSRYPHLRVILEPGSAIAWETGDLVSTVLDIHESHGIQTAILDVSFTAHMPDCLEMPYRPKIIGATDPVEGKPCYRIGGTSCLAGDFMTEYAFDQPLKVGDRVVFRDMIHYTVVKTTMFNGVKHPSIALWTEDGQLKILRKFGYEDYKNRMD
ncbi:MAG: carboxynorspermidine decarboxylase [Bacteroidetes bacterium]|nr:MAG: carboxynorspermidine decarboxylase [Bacteroidota bacterium]